MSEKRWKIGDFAPTWSV